MEILLFVYLAGGLLLGGLSLPMILGKVPPNWLYGFRISKTVNDPQAWYPVNRRMGKWLLATSLIFLLAAVILFFLPGVSVDAYALGCLAAFTVPFIAGIVHSWQLLKTIRSPILD